MKRRKFILAGLASTSLGLSASPLFAATASKANRNLKLSLNTYSFNKELRSGKKTLFDLIPFCKELGFEAIDPTGYYFPGYPKVPDDEYIYDFKRQVFAAGLEISGTGVRNDFGHADKKKLEQDQELIEQWCIVASKLGAPLLRVFPGKEISDGRNKDKVLDQVIAELKVACETGKKYGIVLALQNHNDLVISSDEVIRIFEGVQSEWLGLHLDIGSLAIRDPYEEIERLVKYAVTWQIKELVWVNGKKVPVDYDKLMKIIHASDYNGYLPLETLNADPTKNLPVMIEEMRKRL